MRIEEKGKGIEWRVESVLEEEETEDREMGKRRKKIGQKGGRERKRIISKKRGEKNEEL